MGRFLVNWKGPSMTEEQLESGSKLWDEVNKDFPDIKTLQVMGNLAEGHVAIVLEAPGVERIRRLMEEFNSQFLNLHQIHSETEIETGLDILPLDFQYEGESMVYRREKETAGYVI